MALKGKGLIARKVGMTRIVDSEGQMVPVTLVQIEDQKITKILTPERDGYHGVQIGYLEKTEKHLNRPDIARLRKANVETNFCRFKEFRVEAPLEGAELGTSMDLNALEGVTAVDVTGITKGRGFAGALPRWNHARGRMSHGSRFHRRPGSLGMRSTPGRVFKGKHMPGHMGDVQRTIQNLKVMDIDTDKGLVALKGAVPGHRDGYVVLRASIKAPEAKK